MSNARELAELGGAYSTGGYPHFKNRIINGAMMIDQRNAGASVTPTNGSYTLDRWKFTLSQASKLTAQQSTTVPAGYKNSLLVTSSSAYTVGASEVFQVKQYIEGFNFADMAWGTSSAASISISFQVRSSLTGTFGGCLRNEAGDRNYPFSYTINASNTWETKAITIAGDTSGTWSTGNSVGVEVVFSLGTGSSLQGAAGAWTASAYLAPTGATSVVGTSGATFYITGVQLEKGSTASAYDYRPYGTELSLCQRYYWTLNGRYVYLASYGAASIYITNVYFPVSMRATPTITSNLSGATVPADSVSTLGFGIYNTTSGSNFYQATASAEL